MKFTGTFLRILVAPFKLDQYSILKPFLGTALIETTLHILHIPLKVRVFEVCILIGASLQIEAFITIYLVTFKLETALN